MKITKNILTAMAVAMLVPITSFAATGTASKGIFQYDNNGDGDPEIVIDSSDMSNLNSQLGGMSFTASGTQVTAKTTDGTEIPIGSYVEGTEIPTTADILIGKSAWVNGLKLSGTMPNNGPTGTVITPGTNYKIPLGYTSGGTVTVDSSATADAHDIITGKNAWVNGSKIEGKMIQPEYLQDVALYNAADESKQFGTYLNGTKISSALDAKFNNSGTSTDSAKNTIELGIGQSITLSPGYYDGTLTISNPIINRGSVSSVLTSANKQIKGSAGYYNSIDVSTTATDLTASITYYHHIHSLENTTSLETNTSSDINSVSGGYPDSQYNPSNWNNMKTVDSSYAVGCFTKPVYHVHSGYGGSCWQAYTAYRTVADCHQSEWCYDTDGGHDGWWNCPMHNVCDGSHTEAYTDYRQICGLSTNSIVAYTTGCGHVNGQVIKAEIKY